MRPREVLRTSREVRSALRYVLLNGRKHAKRARGVGIDPASSGRWFDGWRRGTAGPGPRPGAGGPAAVASPHTWLLRTARASAPG